MKAITHGIATFFWVGHLRPAPGTWGSLAALPAGYAIAHYTGFWGLLMATITAFALGLWATGEETRGKGIHCEETGTIKCGLQSKF